jgi:hypothetical protein
MRWRAGVGCAALLLAVTAAPPISADPPKPAWQTIRSEDGIVVSKQEVPGSSLLAFRGEGDVEAPILAVGSVIVDEKQATEWVDSVVEVRLLRRISDVEQVTYTHVSTPFILADRETVTREKLVVDAARKSLVIQIASVDDPLAPRTNRVRVKLDRSSFSLTSVDNGKKTHVVAEIHCDPGGNVPSWLANSFQKSWGFNTLTNLRKQVKKSKRIDPGLRALLEPDTPAP